ncbi:MAG TPA: UbiA prenyltransferase family protein [Kofleriaceae bacterium]|jgi:4-hydroxybenzoate polyprenyltransferase|nr:UbiA prenyltransferase family protein [Kofleriaceae bacterium]
MTALLKTLRPHQWVKNLLFVAAPLVFAQQLTNVPSLVRAAIAVLAFCALSGAVYAFNDVRDVEADRVHPTKRLRPIAAGALSERSALVAAGVLATGAIVACALLSWETAALAAGYLIQNVAYSVGLKRVAFVDVVLIANGFLLRVLAGATAIGVPASTWLLICTTLLAMFLGFGKRAHELAWATRTGETATRASLAGYRLPVIHVAMLVLGVVTCIAYVAYTLDPRTVGEFGTDKLVWSSPFVAIGLLRFLFLSLYNPSEDSPTEAMLKDPWVLADLAAAVATVLYIIYR